jgi:hypothetical protein
MNATWNVSHIKLRSITIGLLKGRPEYSSAIGPKQENNMVLKPSGSARVDRSTQLFYLSVRVVPWAVAEQKDYRSRLGPGREGKGAFMERGSWVSKGTEDGRAQRELGRSEDGEKFFEGLRGQARPWRCTGRCFRGLESGSKWRRTLSSKGKLAEYNLSSGSARAEVIRRGCYGGGTGGEWQSWIA